MATTLPLGFDSLEQLIGSDAGRVYALARIIARRQRTYTNAIDFLRLEEPETVQTCEPPRPDCYALMFADQSILVVSNADDEVWADEADYLAHYDLERSDDQDLGWVYRARIAQSS